MIASDSTRIRIIDFNFLSIWRNGVHFTDLYSGYIVIIMALFSSIKYRQEKMEKKSLIFKNGYLGNFPPPLISLFTTPGIGMSFIRWTIKLMVPFESGRWRNNKKKLSDENKFQEPHFFFVSNFFSIKHQKDRIIYFQLHVLVWISRVYITSFDKRMKFRDT